MRVCFCALVLALSAPPVRAAEPPPIDPRGLPGALVVTGGNELLRGARDAFFLLAGQEKAKIVVVPTAGAADDPKTTDALLKEWEDLKPASVVLLHTRDPKRADVPAFVKPLADATAVWFAGGHPDRVLAAYRGTLFEKELKKLHARGGVIGAGGGANAAVGSLAFASGEKKPTEGFGLLPGFVVERKDRVLDAITDNPTHVGLCVPDGAGLVIFGRVAGVIGTGSVTVHLAKGAGHAAASDEHDTGALLDLVQLRRAALNRAARDPFPPAKPAEPGLAKGALVLAGGGELPADVWKRFIELAGGPEATIVVVPTARVRPLRLGDSEEDALKRFGAKNVVTLHTTDRTEADDPKFSDVLTKAGGVWFTGGRQWRLIDAYEGTLTEKRFHELLARGGVIGGGSAGASIQSEYMPRGHPLGNDVMTAEGYERGFAFLPGCAVDQHFFALGRTGDMTKLMKRYPQYLGIGVDERAAVVVSGRTAEVIGKGSVAFYDAKKEPAGEKDYEELFPKEKYDLKERKKVK